MLQLITTEIKWTNLTCSKIVTNCSSLVTCTWTHNGFIKGSIEGPDNIANVREVFNEQATRWCCALCVDYKTHCRCFHVVQRRDV
jgi:hypothetical protein